MEFSNYEISSVLLREDQSSHWGFDAESVPSCQTSLIVSSLKHIYFSAFKKNYTFLLNKFILASVILMSPSKVL